jgi:putrescine transport system substrate-binding protein
LRIGRVAAALVAAAVLSLAACQRRAAPGEPASPPRRQDAAQVLDLYIWSDYLAPDTIPGFEQATGIKVRVAYFDTNETLESHVLTGHSGYDVVVPTAPFFERQIKSGAYQPLDKRQLPNWPKLDPAIMQRVARNDPGNSHGIVYAWGTYGIGYNERLVAAALPGVKLDSWKILFDPEYASRLAKCGISTIDAPAGIVRLVLQYLGRDPNAPTAQDLADAEATLRRVRPFIRTIDTGSIIEAIANGDMCIGIGYNGDFYQARKRAREAQNGIKIAYLIPQEGSLLWFDMLAIPRDAPHAGNAHRFLNYLMEPRVIANFTNFVGNANANSAATPLIDPLTAEDPAVYPPAAVMQRLFVQTEDPPERARAITALWQRFKTAQ